MSSNYPLVTSLQLDLINNIILNLTSEQLNCFNAVKKNIVNIYPNYKISDHIILKFCRARLYNIENTTNMLLNNIKWRLDNNIDNILDNPPKKLELIKKYLPIAVHNYDRDGRPILYQKLGAANVCNIFYILKLF